MAEKIYPRGLLALAHCTLHIALLIPREVIRYVNTKILLGRDNFKLRAGHMIDKDDGFKFPSDALCFAFAVVLFSNASRR